MNQLEIHRKIDTFFKADIKDADIVIANELLSFNADAKWYFFSKPNEAWLPWMLSNGIFEILKKPAEDTSKYVYKTPELDYLVRIADKDPVTVTKIINTIPISQVSYNPEVIDRFQWIMGTLPIDQIKLLLPKLIKENWIQLMAQFYRSGYEYQRIVEKIITARDYEALNLIVQAVITLRSKEDLAKIERFSIPDRLFYLSDISDTGIFAAVLDPANTQKEESLKLFLAQLTQIVKLGKEKDCSIFDEDEPFYLPDVDLFSIELNVLRHSHPRSDLRNFVATCKKLVDSVFTDIASKDTEIKRIYNTYIASLPDSYTIYRFKLYVTSRFPQIFRAEAEKNLFRLFEIGERYIDIISGAEYGHALIAAFGTFSEEKKREYVKRVFEYFLEELEDKEMMRLKKQRGREILTFIKDKLTETEIAISQSAFGSFLDNLKPHPRSSGTISGYIERKSPFNLADYSVLEIIKHLKTDWAPALLKERFEGDSFLIERGAEGLGDGLRNNFKERMPEYLINLENFFDREFIDPSYIYAILREIDEMLRNKKFPTKEEQYQSLINLFNLIRKSGEANKFEKSNERSYLADWVTVHNIIADITLNMLASTKDSPFFRRNRDAFFAIIKYLLSIDSSPNAEDEKPEYGEPFGVAINSVRGQAFRALTQFVYVDNERLSTDVKVLYEHLLSIETSTAVRFMIGHFLASFYFRDTPFIQSMMPKIFPRDIKGKEKEYFATWEGYLANSLYKELFEELKDYYLFAISLKKEVYPSRKYFEGLDKTLAAHVALAYTEFTLKEGDEIFDTFWNTPSEERHSEFVSFVGKHYLTRSQANEWLKEYKIDKEKIVAFWYWILQTQFPIEPKAFASFGFWINPDEEVIDNKIVIENIATSLKKANGELNWEFGLMKRINEFAKINPEKTLEIITRLLILNGDLNPNHRVYFDATRQIGEPLKIIYEKPQLKQTVIDLISLLIEKGSSVFWSLKKIVESEN